MKIRENAFAYLHGHEVGGTNPSLLEALASTRLSLLLDVGFNREVAEGAALYWTKEAGSLIRLIMRVESVDDQEANVFRELSREMIRVRYSWNLVVSSYEKLFLEN